MLHYATKKEIVNNNNNNNNKDLCDTCCYAFVNTFLQKCLKKKQLFLLYLTMFFQISTLLKVSSFRTARHRSS